MKTHSEHEHIEELIEGYALNALDPEERNLVDQHTSRCSPCRKQLRVTEEAVHMLGFIATPIAPPLRCKRKILEKIEREQFLHTPTRRARTASPFSTWATVAALVLLVATGMWGVSLQRQIGRMSSDMARARNEIAELEGMLAEVQEIRSLKGEGSSQYAVANTFMKPGSNKALLVIRNLPPLSAGQTYKVWVARDGMQEGLTTFNPPPADDTIQVSIEPREPMDHYKWIMVTIENTQPTDHPSQNQALFGDL